MEQETTRAANGAVGGKDDPIDGRWKDAGRARGRRKYITGVHLAKLQGASEKLESAFAIIPIVKLEAEAAAKDNAI